MSKHEKPLPAFTIRLSGMGVSPETIPVRTLSDAASAVLRLMTADQPDDTRTVHVLDVRNGSAIYPCSVDGDSVNGERLVAAGKVANDPQSDLLTHTMLAPIQMLSRIARKLGGSVEVYVGHKRGKPAAVFSPHTFQAIRGTSISYDQAVVTGNLLRVGGAQAKRCTVRVPGRDNLLYCSVETDQLSRELGQNLYKRVTLRGKGMFFSRTWELLKLDVQQASFNAEVTPREVFMAIRDHGPIGWDNVLDVRAELEDMR